VPRFKTLFVDLAVSASLPLLAVWLYEVSNYIVLAAQGNSVSLSTSGWIPLGVSDVSLGGISPFTKAAQVVVAVGLLLPLGTLMSRARLFLARTMVVSFLAVYLASTYWEMLSLLTFLPMAAHAGFFIAGAGAISIVLLSSPGQRVLKYYPARTAFVERRRG
jgi:hypothetical protein